jgi:hypothetical protein
MANKAEIKLTPIPGAGDEIARSPELRAWLAGQMRGVADNLRSEAPVKTGAGRASITSAVDRGTQGWVGTAGWDSEHYYMGLQQSRTHWADGAIARVRYV